LISFQTEACHVCVQQRHRHRRGIKGPIGRVGAPVTNREYVFFEAMGIELYIEKELVDKVSENDGRINVLMGDYGVRSIYISDADKTE